MLEEHEAFRCILHAMTIKGNSIQAYMHDKLLEIKKVSLFFLSVTIIYVSYKQSSLLFLGI